MKYLLFAGHNYYPEGGVKDYRMQGTVEECKKWFEEHKRDISAGSYVDNWAQIVDEETFDIVLYGRDYEDCIK